MSGFERRRFLNLMADYLATSAIKKAGR